jgi:hypothetical protein
MTQQNSQETPLVYMVWKRVFAIAHGIHVPQLKVCQLLYYRGLDFFNMEFQKP